MMQTYFIITSSNQDEPNWEGKGFCKLPCKIYRSFQDASDALSGYWFNEFVPFDNRRVNIHPITQEHVDSLIRLKAARL